MRLPFLDRASELERLRRALDAKESSLLVAYGRRRVGKSRLLQEAIRGRRAVYYVGDERDAALQRVDLAREIAELVPGFADVNYPSWEPLLERWWRDAPGGGVLVLDEFPFLVRASPELPSLLQKSVDRPGRAVRHTILSGSSQRMMQGLVLAATAPLYGRAREILQLEPLGAGWIRTAFGIRDAATAVDQYAAWGGIPRYWELAREHTSRRAAVEALVLDPLGVLHREPDRLLLDDLDQTSRAASLLSLIGQGCHRVSEIGGRIGVPATSLARPLTRLIELGFVARDVPFGRSPRDTKRTYYRIADPFLRLWYRFVEPARSRLAARQITAVARSVEAEWPRFLGSVWEEMARASVPRLAVAGRSWSVASRWWGPDGHGQPLEVDILAEAADGSGDLLVGEAKLRATASEIRSALDELRRKTARLPVAQGREVTHAIWVHHGPDPRDPRVVHSGAVLDALR